MTPERIEEIKQMVADDDVTPFGPEYIIELLAALEEAQQQAELAYAAYEGLQGFCVSRGEYDSLLNKHSVLARAHREVQQTIARQQKVIDWYESGGSMGELLEEGEVQP
ncbi:hypothetical protein [Paenibacillus sp. FSL R10-2771]|uniref:hypothetical protein n=1 Tax=Paenibacillus sp. FSL R10-2771 TaxID=2954693 RepID=UPI0030F5D5E3